MKQWLLNLGALVFGICLMAAILELCTRFIAPDWLNYRMEVLNAGKLDAAELGSDANWPVVKENGVFKNFKPNSSFHVNHYEYSHVANIDSFGARTSGSCHLDMGNHIIPFMGDSFTFGVGAKDNETYVSLLNDKTDQCILNLGLPGSALEQQLDVVRLRHEELGEPHLYVFNVFLGNDISFHKDSKSITREMNIASTSSKSATDQLLAKVNDWVYHNPLIKKSYFIQYVRAKMVILYNNIRTRKKEFKLVNPIFHAMNRDYERYMKEFIAGEMQELEALAEQKQFNYVFIVLPDIYQVYEELRHHQIKYYGFGEAEIDVNQPNRLYAEALRAKGRHYLDVTSCFAEVRAEENLYYTQDNHFRPIGHRIAADCIYPWLVKVLESENYS